MMTSHLHKAYLWHEVKGAQGLRQGLEVWLLHLEEVALLLRCDLKWVHDIQRRWFHLLKIKFNMQILKAVLWILPDPFHLRLPDPSSAF